MAILGKVGDFDSLGWTFHLSPGFVSKTSQSGIGHGSAPRPLASHIFHAIILY